MTSPNDGAPLTRRQLREQAAQAAQAAPVATGVPPEAHVVVPVQPTVQRPAAQTSSPILTLAAPPAVPPAAPPAALLTPAAPLTPTQPRLTRQGPSRRSLREKSSSLQVLVVPPAQTSGVRTIDETGRLSPVRDLGSGRPAMTARPQVLRPASGVAVADADSTPVVRAPALPEPAVVPASASWQPILAAAAEIPEPMPRWDSNAVPRPESRPLPRAEDPDGDAFDVDEPDHKYTWLHYLILIAVAFVLGLIIWKVALENRGADSSADSTASHGIVVDAPRTLYDHDL